MKTDILDLSDLQIELDLELRRTGHTWHCDRVQRWLTRKGKNRAQLLERDLRSLLSHLRSLPTAPTEQRAIAVELVKSPDPLTDPIGVLGQVITYPNHTEIRLTCDAPQALLVNWIYESIRNLQLRAELSQALETLLDAAGQK